MPGTMTAVQRREWELFQDWCTAMDTDAVPAGRTLVETFKQTFPGSAPTWRRRIHSIRLGLAENGYVLDWPRPESATPFKVGERWAPIRRALAQVETTRFPTGLRGRRDAWLLLLVGELGFTRREAQSITQKDIVLFPTLTIRGRIVQRAETPGECPQCAVTRWLRVYGPAAFGFWNEVKEILNPWADTVAAHDCGFGLDGVWRVTETNSAVSTMTPSIDVHGWLGTDVPLSLTSISRILHNRQRLTGVVEPALRRPVVKLTAAETRQISDELSDEFDELDARLEALFAATKQMLDDTNEAVRAAGM